MPLPLLLAAPALAGVAATGLKKGYDGFQKFRSARAIDADARELYEVEAKVADEDRDACEEALAALGAERERVFNETMPAFIEVIARLRNASVAAEAFNDRLDVDDIPPGALHEVALRQQELLGAAAASTLGAVAASQAATVGVSSWAAASTGTAISTLGGGAASNAALAWLGGGTLASGGAGIAGGTLVLSGIAAAPAMLIGGFIFDRQMTAKLRQAQTNAEEVAAAGAKLRAQRAQLSALRAAAEAATPVFQQVRTKVVKEAGALAAFADDELDVERWPGQRQDRLRVAANLAGALVGLASSRLIDETGGLDPRFHAALARAQ